MTEQLKESAWSGEEEQEDRKPAVMREPDERIGRLDPTGARRAEPTVANPSLRPARSLPPPRSGPAGDVR
jgi:hypothetical protein